MWSGAAFLAVGLAGLVLLPVLWVLWLVLVVFGIAAVPQAFLLRQEERPRRSRRDR